MSDAVEIPGLRLDVTANSRLHWAARAKRVKRVERLSWDDEIAAKHECLFRSCDTMGYHRLAAHKPQRHTLQG